jgi:uncharacterized membrane protein
MIWFYAENGEQKGPVSEDELKQLFSYGGKNADDLVWKEGMAEWASFASVFGDESGNLACPTCGTQVQADELIPAGDNKVCPNCRDTYAQGLKEGLRKPVSAPGNRGTGGLTTNRDLRTMAREALVGKWGLGVVSIFIMVAITQVISFIPLLGILVVWAISGPFSLGIHKVFLNISRDEDAEVGIAFSGFSNFVLGLGLYLLTMIIVGLVWSVVAIPGGIMIAIAFSQGQGQIETNPLFIIGILISVIPGGIAATYVFLRLSMSYYIANDYPDLGVIGALKESDKITTGHKWKLFLLYLSFIGWHFLGALVFIIGMLWSVTYMHTALAGFYDDIQEAKS